jgi:ribose transport system permease protein
VFSDPARTYRYWLHAGLSRGSLIGVWIALIGLFTVIEPGTFLTGGTFQVIFGSQQALVFLAMAALCAFTVGEFDLSVASNLGLAAILVPVLAGEHHVNVVLANVVAVAAAVLVGSVNATVIVGLGIDPIVTTLGMATLLSGLSLEISGSTTVGGLPLGAARIANTVVLGLPVTFYYGLAIALAFWYVLRCTALGRHMVFVGANRAVARLAGVRVTRIRVGAYLCSGLLAGLGGVILVDGLGGFDPSTPSSYLLPALSAAFLGTAVIEPGRFNPLGTLVAIYFLVTGIVGLQLLGLAGWVSDVFYGAALIIAVIFSSVARQRLRR